jgi:predicted acyltransferase
MNARLDSRPGRLVSLDALRGADMLLIVGGREVVRALAESPGGRALGWLAAQCEHAEWHGCTLWDVVFPLFLFLSGATVPLSFARRRAAGDARGALLAHVARRGLMLVLLGVVYNGLLSFDWASLRYASVLGRIGLAWAGAACVTLYCGRRGRALWVAALLLGYWALLALVPAPGRAAPSFEPGLSLTDWFDRTFLPGRLHRGVRDPEGLLATLPAVATALLGGFTGEWLADARRGARARLLGLAGAGVGALALGWLWGRVLPINKSLWTGSFVLWTAGWSLLCVALFHLIFDVLGWRRLAFPLVVVGANAITVYLLEAFVDLRGPTELLLARSQDLAYPRLHPALVSTAPLAGWWLLLFWLYRRRVFLRL